MPLQFKRGPNSQRAATILSAGEPFFVTDYATQAVAPFWIGNGTTIGGVPAANFSNLDEIPDISFTSIPTNNQLLQYNSSINAWQNFTNVVIPGTLTSTGAATLNQTLAVTGNTTLNQTLAVTGNTTLTGDLAVNGGDITSTSSQGNLFNVGVPDINIGNDATTAVRLGSEQFGEVHVKSPLLKINGNIGQGPVNNNTNHLLNGIIFFTVTNSTTATNLSGTQFEISRYRTMEFTLQASRTIEHQTVKCIVTHNGSSAFINTVSSLATGANLFTVTPIITSGNLALRVTSTSATTTTYKGYYTLLAI